MFAGHGGLRINSSDYTNTIYQDLVSIETPSADIGFTLRDYSFFNFNSLSSGNVNTNLCNMSMAGISFNKNATGNGSVGIGMNPSYQLEINISSYTVPLLCIDSGTYGQGGNPRALDKPLIKLGKSAWIGAGDYYRIGFGYAINTTDCCCCEIGCMITNRSAGEIGDLLFSTCDSTTASTPATERMSITNAGKQWENFLYGFNWLRWRFC